MLDYILGFIVTVFLVYMFFLFVWPVIAALFWLVLASFASGGVFVIVLFFVVMWMLS